MASLFLFLTSCSQSVGQIPLLEHRQPHTLTLFPLHKNPLLHTHTHFVSLAHTYTLPFSHTKPMIKTHTHNLPSSFTQHTQSNYSSQEEKKEHQGHFRGGWRKEERGDCPSFAPFYHSLSVLLLFNIFHGFLF